MAFDFPTSPTVGQQYSPVAGTTYTYNGVGWTLAQGAGAFGAPLAIRTFTASGSYVPTFGTAMAIVECIAGGGGGGGCANSAAGQMASAGAGGAGGRSIKLVTAAQIGTSQVVTIGAAGAAGTAGNNAGGVGGDTSIGTLCVARGGNGGGGSAGNVSGAAGLGGSGASGTGDITAPGANGDAGTFASIVTLFAPTSHGGNSPYGSGGHMLWGVSAAGITATGFGAGGGGGSSYNGGGASAGGAGSPGVCIITEYGPLSSVATSVQIKTFTANGNYVPPAGLLSAIVECVGGGGGGGGVAGSATAFLLSGGGGSGAYSRRSLTAAQIGASQSVTVGAAGSAGPAGSNPGGAGGDTSLGTLCVAKGGGGGGAFNGGLGGSTSGSVGDITAAGAPGTGGEFSAASVPQAFIGQGGSSIFGGGGQSSGPTGGAGAAGAAASNYGSGGSGATANTIASNFAGGAGSAGVVIITEFIAVSAVAAPGFPVQIARVDVSSPVAQVDFTSGIDGTYDEYELHCIGVQISAAGNSHLIRVSQDGGSTWKAGASDYGWFARYQPIAGAADLGSASATSIFLGNSLSGNTNFKTDTIIKFARPWATDVRKQFMYDTISHNATNGMFRQTGGGYYTTDSNAINGVRITMTGGNITAGTFILYGIKK